MASTVTVELSLSDMAIILVALADLKNPDGDPGWANDNVARLRAKLADAIREQVPA